MTNDNEEWNGIRVGDRVKVGIWTDRHGLETGFICHATVLGLPYDDSKTKKPCFFLALDAPRLAWERFYRHPWQRKRHPFTAWQKRNLFHHEWVRPLTDLEKINAASEED